MPRSFQGVGAHVRSWTSPPCTYPNNIPSPSPGQGLFREILTPPRLSPSSASRVPGTPGAARRCSTRTQSAAAEAACPCRPGRATACMLRDGGVREGTGRDGSWFTYGKPHYHNPANNPICAVLFSASFTYSGDNSIKMEFRPFCSATSPVVPLPPKGSRTVPPIGHPARMQGRMSAGGNVAKCAPL